MDLIIRRNVFFALVIAIPAMSGWAQSLTDGWSQYADSFYVQNRTAAPMDQRYTFVDGVHSCQLYKGEERVEMRWNTWPNQDLEHMWEADMMFEVGTSNTAVMQVKSNESGEAVYMQVFNGDLFWGGNGGQPLLAGHAGQWYHMNVAWNRVTGVGRVWIDGELKATRNHDKGVNWYFKNGTYGTSNHSKSNYRNIKTWVHIPSSAWIRPIPVPKNPAVLFIDALGKPAVMPRIAFPRP